MMPEENEGISMLALGSVLLRWRRLIVVLLGAGAVIGLANALSKPRMYTSAATFVPHSSGGTPSGLALAASQLGVSVAPSGGDWGPPMYVEVINSRALLEPIAADTFAVSEEGGRRLTLLQLLGIKGPTHEREVTSVVGALRGMISATEAKKLGGVTLTVKTKWPSVSLALADRLLQRINQFNLETRKSQAVAEREFVEAQAVESERALRSAEDRLQGFLQANRQIDGSPGLVFERDRLQREVARQSQLYTSWLQSREEARIREIRDIPVITVFESPRLPFKEEPRKVFLKTVMGGTAGAIIGVFLAFILGALSRAKRAESGDAREFRELLEGAKPQFLRRMKRRNAEAR